MEACHFSGHYSTASQNFRMCRSLLETQVKQPGPRETNMKMERNLDRREHQFVRPWKPTLNLQTQSEVRFLHYTTSDGYELGSLHVCMR